MSLLRRAAIALPFAGVGAAAAWCLNSDAPAQRAASLYLIPVRLSRDVVAATSILADYSWSLRGLDGQALVDAKSACHLRSARKLVDVAFANGAIYIKAGQHVGQLDHLLPPEYVLTMRSHLLDKCPLDSYDAVSRTVSEDLGAPPESLFASFEPRPIASASLAQVHRATSHNGQQLAVKVQHAGLRETAAADVATIEMLVAILGFVLPEFDYTWLVDSTKESLPQELDFRVEAANAARCAANFTSETSVVQGQVAIPEVLDGLSSERVLTMEYMTGVGVTDIDALKREGLNPAEVAKLVAEIFAEMTFIYGDVHCDPHQANMLARRRDGRPQIVLLDHGLYKRISDDFRIQYAKLWRSLILADVDGIKAASIAMNAGDSYQLFAGMLTNRPWEEIANPSSDHLRLEHSEAEREAAADIAQRFAVEICDLLRRMPRALLLLLKTNDCLRSVDYALGTPVNTFLITAKECTRALNEQRLRLRPGLHSRLANAWDSATIRWRMALLSAATWVMQMRRRFGRHGREVPGLDQGHVQPTIGLSAAA